MSHKITSAIEQHPILGWFASAFSLGMGWLSWMVEHADDAAKVFGVFAAIFGCVAGYCTMRIQWETWQKRKAERPIYVAPRPWRRRR